ncbi:hypothetical protein HA402_009127 [Bradysia odoriphaga]|nr:hypothetical protein HA402_009127 [Bradysia odoriphaga]
MSQNTFNDLFSDVVNKHDDHDHDHDHEDESNPITAKAIAMVVLFLAALVAGLAPFKLASWFKLTDAVGTAHKRASLIVSLLLAFGGGVLLCTTFMHLLPEVKENIEHLQESGDLPELKFHFAEFLMCIGFFTMYFVEELVHLYLNKRGKNSRCADNAFQRGVSIRNSTIMSSKNAKNHNGDRHSSVADLISNETESSFYQPHTHAHIVPKQSNQISSISGPMTVSDGLNGHHNHIHHAHSHLPDVADDDLIVSSLRGLLIVLALSVHELFEGLAVGLEDTPATVWYMFGAVAAHKLVLAFCVGVELIVAKTQKWLAFVYVFTFAAVSPMGIGIGILISGESTTTGLISAILQGLASGTLLYVVFFEILQKGRSGILQFFAVIFGYSLMFGLTFITGHEHSHDDGHGHAHSFPENLHDLVLDYHNQNENNADDGIQKKFNLLRAATDEIKNIVEHHIHDD